MFDPMRFASFDVIQAAPNGESSMACVPAVSPSMSEPQCSGISEAQSHASAADDANDADDEKDDDEDDHEVAVEAQVRTIEHIVNMPSSYAPVACAH